MGDSLQSYFSNLLAGGCGGIGGGGPLEIVSDNARSPRNSLSGGEIGYDWFTDCCSMDTTIVTSGGGLCGLTFSRWDSVPTYETRSDHDTKQDTAPTKRPRRRCEGSESDSPLLEEDLAAIFLPTEDALDHGHRRPCSPTTVTDVPGGTTTHHQATTTTSTKPTLSIRND